MFKSFKIINLNIIHIDVNNKFYNFINKERIIEFNVFKVFEFEKFA